jgi:DNA-binding NarL/FixJ family response regulator
MSVSCAPWTVLLVDDHAVVREGYKRLLERQGDVTVVGEAADAAEALQLFARLRPQIVVMDVSLPDISGIEATRRLLARDADARVLMFSMHEDAIFARRALQAGASGYVTKACEPDVLLEAVRWVAQGRRYVSAGVAADLAATEALSQASAPRALTAREFEILRLLTQGRSIRQIGRSMGLSPKTVSNHQTSIRQKLAVNSAVQLLQAAERLGLAGPSPRGPDAV